MARGRMTYGQAVVVDMALGAVAGLIAAAAMQAFQVAAKSQLDDLEPEQLAKAKTAEALSQKLAGRPLPENYKAAAETGVHYATGALVGAVYGFVAGAIPFVTIGRGLAFGAAVWALGDEVAMPAFGLRPSEIAPEKHTYGAASHAAFAFTLDFARRKLNELIAR